MAEEFDPFQGTSGLADDIDVTFEDVVFGPNPQYVTNEGDMPVVMTANWRTDDPDHGVLENQILTIGKGWVAEDGGKKVVREDGKQRGFNKSTKIQQIVERCFELDGGEEILRGRYEDTGLTPMDAGFWEGLTLHMNLEEMEVGFGDNARKRDVLMPTEIKGWGGEAKPAAKKAPAKKAAAKKPAKKAAAKAETNGAGEVDGATISAIRAIAEGAETYEEFVDEAYSSVEGIEESAEIQALVDDDSENSIWGKALAAYEAANS